MSCRARSITGLHFADEVARAACRDTLTAIEFAVEDESQSEEEGEELPYALVVSRVDSIDSHTINGITIELARLAREYRGHYDGWECAVTQARRRADAGCGRASKRLAEYHGEIVGRHAHHLLALQAVQRGHARDLVEVAQAPLGLRRLSVASKSRLDGAAVPFSR